MVSLLGSSSVGFAGAGFPRDFPHVCPLHTCPCTRSPCTPGHLVFSRQPQQSLFCSRSAPFGRGSDSSSTESKQLPFRGSKYFAMCYFSVIYYEGIFSLLSQDLTTLQSHQTWPWLCKGRLHLCFPPAILGGPREVSPSPGSPLGPEGVLQELGSAPARSKLRDTWDGRFGLTVVVGHILESGEVVIGTCLPQQAHGTASWGLLG